MSRPGTATLVRDQLTHATTDLWRSKVVAAFSFVVPMVWLVVIGFLAGNDAVDEETGVRVMQFVTPTAAAMGVLYATYPTIAISVAEARETGVLKRLHGTPLPPWAYLAGRLGSSVVFASVAVAAMLLLGVVVYDVQMIGGTALALVVTLLLGMACFTSLGLAVAAVSRSVAVAQGASISTAVALTFVSGMFTFGGTMPAWLETLGDVFPLKPFAEALQNQLNPFHTGAGWDSGLWVVLAWTAGSVLVAARRFSWEPARGGRRRGGPPAVVAGEDRGTGGAGAARTWTGPGSGVRSAGAGEAPTPRRTEVAAPSAWALGRGQLGAALTAAWRDPGSQFFAVVMPVGLYAFMLTTQPVGLLADGTPFATFFAASMAVWGTAVAAFMNLPEQVAFARDRRVLKRLRGTPLRPWEYLAGRVGGALVLGLLITAAVLAVGVVAYELEITAAGLVVGAVLVALGAVTFAACGLALVSALPDAKAVSAVTLVVLLPLAFFSDVFIVGAPEWMRTVGSFFPLQHLQNALVEAWSAGGPTVSWQHVAVLLVWCVGATLVAVRTFRWEPAR